MKNENVSCLNIGCEYFDNLMELNCSYSEDNKKCIKTEKPIASHAVMGDRAEVIELFRWLLGYDDFPSRMDGEGLYYWRKELRRKLKDIGIVID